MLHEHVRMGRRGVSRRGFLHTVSVGTVGAGAVAAGTLSLRDLVSLQAAELSRQGRSMILLWMSGGPSQFESFDPKPGHENGGPTEAIDTAVPGIRIAQGWERTAEVMGELAVIRSMNNREGSHPRATYQLHTGYAPAGSVKHPSIGANLARQLADPQHPLPSVVSVGGRPLNSGSGAGFLGVQYEPFVVRQPGQLPENVALPRGTDTARFNRRLGLLDRLEDEFAARGAEDVVGNHRQVYQKTARMVLSPETKAFSLADEPDALRRHYGETPFGRSCLLARRLVEAGVTFIEVFSPGWDTHEDNFTRSGQLAAQVDPGTAALVADLKDRGLLERTLVVWMGEFGRTPRVNPRTGRDHYPRAFSAVLAGGGVKGGQVIGRTSADGSTVADRPVTVPDLFCSVCQAMGVDPRLENISPLGRPMKIVDGGEPVAELF